MIIKQSHTQMTQMFRIIVAPSRVVIVGSLHPAGAWSFSVSELAAPGVEVGRLTATDPDLGENAQLEFTIMDAEEAETFNITGRDREAVIVLNKVSEQKLSQYFPMLVRLVQECVTFDLKN